MLNRSQKWLINDIQSSDKSKLLNDSLIVKSLLDGVLGQDFRPKQDPIIILKSKSHTEKDLPLCSTMHTDSIYHPTTKFLMFFENIYTGR